MNSHHHSDSSRNLFSVSYQPIINYNDREIFALHAGMTWKRKNQHINIKKFFSGDAMSPSMALSLNSFFIRTALRNLKEIQEKSKYSGPLSFNISPAVAVRPAFIVLLGDIIASEEEAYENEDKKFNRKNIIFEITADETSSSQVEDAISSISEIGVGVSVKGFGLEKMNPSTLMNKRVNFIKISKRITSTILTDKSSRIFAEHLLSLTNYLNKVAIVEGIDFFEQLSLFRSEGYNIFQGDYILPTVSIEKVTQYIINTCLAHKK